MMRPMSLALVSYTSYDLTLWYSSSLLSEFQNVSFLLPAHWYSLIMPSCLIGSGLLSCHFRGLGGPFTAHTLEPLPPVLKHHPPLLPTLV